MTKQRHIEIFSAGCPICERIVKLVEEMACPSCDVTVQDMNAPEGAMRAEELGVLAVPTVAVDGELVACSTGTGPNRAALEAAGVGKPLA